MANPKQDAAPTAPKFKVKRRVTVPLVKLNPKEPLAVRFTGDTKTMQIGEGKEAALVARAVDLSNGAEVDVIVSTVLKSTIDREYGGFVKGKALPPLLLETSRREGKKYNDVTVSELEV